MSDAHLKHLSQDSFPKFQGHVSTRFNRNTNHPFEQPAIKRRLEYV